MLQNRNIHKVNHLTGAVLVMLIIGSLDQASAFNNPPARCAGLGNLQSFSKTDWDNGLLGSWTVDTHDVSNPVPGGFVTPDWAVVGDLPDGRFGKAAFVADVDNPDNPEKCEIQEQFGQGALTLESTTIPIPVGALVPRISIDHWFATDEKWDGGNLKIKVNGGQFELIPASAIEVGSYHSTLRDPFNQDGVTPLNLNPLAGQDAFTTDSDVGPSYGWGQSHINLQGIAAPGDTIQLQFDFGVDECDGWVGWYVDDVEFYSCSTEIPPSDTSLTLVKEVVNDNGGSASASVWTLSADGLTPFSGSGPTVSSGAEFAPGTYDLSESGGSAGYSASAWECVGGNQNDDDTITLALDEVATCTITNDDNTPGLTLVKVVKNNSGGSAVPADWTLTAAGPTGFNGSGPSVSNGPSFDAGTYDLSENGEPAGYTASAWVCDGGTQSDADTVILAPGEFATCTITNDDVIDLSELIFKDGFE